ncbi:MAG: hypothetical protein ACM3N9_08360 [Syntrophothermus sp.]
MKKYLLLLTFVLTVFSASSQIIHISGGPVFTRIRWSEWTDLSDTYYKEYGLVRANVNIGFDYLNKKYFFLSSNFGYLQKGGKNEMIYSPASSEFNTLHLSYLTLNTLFVLKTDLKKFQPCLSLGPRVDYLLGSEYEAPGMFSGTHELNEEFVNSFIYGITAGIGLNYNVERFRIGVGSQYLYNFNKAANSKTSGSSATLTDHTFLLNLDFGYKF